MTERKIEIQRGSKEDYIIYLHDEFDSKIHAFFQGRHTVVLIKNNDWEKDFTPFPHNKVFHGGRDFSGGAKDYLKELVEEIVPSVEMEIGFKPKHRIIAGYSLAGLFAFYAGMNSYHFDEVCCCSGSLWYPGYVESLEKVLPPSTLKKVYLSLGDKESKTKNPYLLKAEDCMRKVEAYLAKNKIESTFFLEQGGHFEPSDPRLERGLRYLLDETKIKQ